MLEKIILLSKIVNKQLAVISIKSGGGTGPAMPGNPRKREGAKSCGIERFREIGTGTEIPFRNPPPPPGRGFFFEEVDGETFNTGGTGRT